LTALDSAVRDFTKESGTPGYRYALVDLNGDGQADAVILLTGEYCGSGGCTLLVLRGSEGSFKLISSSTTSSDPIRVLEETNYGWKSLLVNSHSIGEVVMRFNGVKYPLNPSLQPVATEKQARLGRALEFEFGGSPAK
jgi:hypothetical protein